MGRLIDEDSLKFTNFEIVMCEGDFKQAFKLLCEKLDNAPTVDAEPKWIPVNERLPEIGDYVLLCFREGRDCPYNRIKVGKLGSHEVEDKNFIKIGVKTVWYTDQWYCDFDKVIAWMPIPEPYKEAPTVDAEVRHGHWVKPKGSLWDIGTCSVCGEFSVEGENALYCPHCGAKMDEVIE